MILRKQVGLRPRMSGLIGLLGVLPFVAVGPGVRWLTSPAAPGPHQGEVAQTYVCGIGSPPPAGEWYDALIHVNSCLPAVPAGVPNAEHLLDLRRSHLHDKVAACMPAPPPGQTPGQVWQALTKPSGADDPCNYHVGAVLGNRITIQMVSTTQK